VTQLVIRAAVRGTATDLRGLLRDAAAPDAVERILDRLSRSLDCQAVVAGPDDASGEHSPRQLSAEVEAVAAGRTGAVATLVDGRAAHLLPCGGQAPREVLVVVANRTGTAFSPAQLTLLADAAVALGLAWQARVTRERQLRLDVAEARNRETVLHLLMVGATAGARKAAAALGPRLPDMVRIHLVDCAGRSVVETARWCARQSGGTAWVVRCPVYRRHVIVIAAADTDALTARLRDLAAGDTAYHVGSGHVVPLSDTASGYQQAFHALSAARQRPDRHASFRARGDLCDLLAEVGAGWAAQTLAPLAAYRPPRPQDPGAEELIATLGSWLSFGSLASRQLKIHRNTLAARLRLISTLLDAQLEEVSAQAHLYLALRLHGPPGDPEVTLPELLARSEARHWAHRQLAALRSDPHLVGTLQVWLAHRAHLPATASALGISPSGLRKRLLRIESLLQRSLLTSPSARHDLFLALAATTAERSVWPPDTHEER
jgi:hypothetical protein